jgi:RHS repeat-associated protein
MSCTIALIRGSTLRAAPGVLLPSGKMAVVAKDERGRPVPAAELECHVLFGGGRIIDPLTSAPAAVVRGVADGNGEWDLPQIQVGPEAGPNRLLVQSLHASLPVDIVGDWRIAQLVFLSPAPNTEVVASWSVDVEARAIDTLHNLGIPDLPLEIEVLSGQATFAASANGASAPVGLRRTGPDGGLRFSLETGWRHEAITMRLTPYLHRAIPAATLGLRIRTPSLLTYRTSGGTPTSQLGSLPVPFRNAVSRNGTLPTSANPDADLQYRFAISRTEGTVKLHPTYAAQYIQEWSWFPEPTGPGLVRAYLRLPDHPDTAELAEEWSIVGSPHDGSPRVTTTPAGGVNYVQSTGGGDRDRGSLVQVKLTGPLVQYVGPNAVSPEKIDISCTFLPPLAAFPTRRIIEARIRSKVRVSPYNSSIDNGAAPTVTAGRIGPTRNGPWSDEITTRLSPGGTATRPTFYFMGSSQNDDHHVEITAAVTLEELDANGNVRRWDQDAAILLRAAFMRPRLNFVRMRGPDPVPILEESIRPVVAEDAAGQSLALAPDDEFRLELLAHDLGASITADITAGETLSNVVLKKVDTTPTCTRYRSGPCFIFLHEITSGQARPLPPSPDVAFIWAGHATRARALIRNGMPGNNNTPRQEYRTGNRPLPQLSLVEVGDAEEDMVLPKPTLTLRIPDSTELPVRVNAGQILATIEGEVRDLLGDLGAGLPVEVTIDGSAYPLTPAWEASTLLRPNASVARFSAEIPVVLGIQHVAIEVENVFGRRTTRSLGLTVIELDNNRRQPRRLVARACPYVPPAPRLPVLRYVYAEGTAPGSATIPADLPITLRLLGPFPSASAISTHTVVAAARPTANPTYATAAFLLLREDEAATVTVPLPPWCVSLPESGRLEWSAEVPNALAPIRLLGLTRPITSTLALEVKDATGGWIPATLVRQGDRVRPVGRLLGSDSQRIEATLSFCDVAELPVPGAERGVFVVLTPETIGQPKLILEKYLDRNHQEQPATEIVICSDDENPPPGGEPFVRIAGVGFLRLGDRRIPAAILPKRFMQGSEPMRQEGLGTRVFRIGPGPCVVPATGEVVYSATDLAAPARGIDLSVGRTWRSGNDYPGTLGWGWSASWDEFAWHEGEAPEDKICYFTAGGHRLDFTRDPAATSKWIGPKGFYGRLEEFAGGLRLRLSQGMEKRLFSVATHAHAIWRLLSIEDRFGNLEKWTFPAHGRPAIVTDPLAREAQLRFGISRAKMEALGDWSGRDWSFQISNASDVEGDANTLRDVLSPPVVHFPGERPKRRATRYTWEGRAAQNRLHSCNDPAGVADGLFPLVRFGWLTDSQVDTVQDARGGWAFSFTAGQTTSTDPLGRDRLILLAPSIISGFAPGPESVQATLNGRIIETTYAYNGQGELTRQSTPLGAASEWIFDDGSSDPRTRGTVLAAIQHPVPGAPSNVTPSSPRFAPNALFAPQAVPGLRTESTYDQDFQLLKSFRDQAGHVTTWKIVDGFVLEERMPKLTVQGGKVPRVTKREWNRWGQLLREINLQGVITRFEYFPQKDPCGLRGSTPISAVGQPGGFLARIVHDAVEPGATRSPSLAPARPVPEVYRYDLIGHQVREQIGAAGATLQELNALGEKIAEHFPDGSVTQYRLDANGRVVEESVSVEDRDFPADIPVAAARKIRHAFVYDRSGQKTEEVVDPDGVALKTTWEYDGCGRLRRESKARVHDVAAPRPFSTVDYDVDELDRVVRITTARGSPDGEMIREMDYDDDGRLVEDGTPIPGGGRRGGHFNQWDGLGRRIAITDRIGNRTTFEYDEMANVTVRRVIGSVAGERPSSQAPILAEQRCFFDEANHAIAVMDRAFKLELGAAGWTERPIGLGYRARVFTRDPFGRETALFTDPPSVMATIQYDGHGLKVAETDGLSESAAYLHDDEGRLVQVQSSSARGTVTLEIRRDNAGRRLAQVIDGKTIQEWRYDSLGRARLQLDAFGNPIEYVYDGGGRRTRIITRMYDGGSRLAGGSIRPVIGTEEVTESYDAESHSLACTDPAGIVTLRQAYDDRGFIVSRTLPDDSFNLVAPEPGGGTRLINRDDNPGDSVWKYSWERDGQTSRVTDPLGRWIAFDYDEAGRLTARRTGSDPGATPAPGTTVQTLKWDALERVVEATDDNGVTGRGVTLRQQYTSLGGIAEVEQAENLQPRLQRIESTRTRCDYRRDGARLSIHWPAFLAIEYRPDAVGRVQSVHDLTAGTEIASYIWDGGRMERRTSGGGKFGIEVKHDAQGRLQSFKAAQNADFVDPARLLEGRRYEYDAAGLPDKVFDLRSELQLPAGPNPVSLLGYDSRGRTVAQVRGEKLTMPVAAVLPTGGALLTYDRTGNVVASRDYDRLVGRANRRIRYQLPPGVSHTRETRTFLNGANQIGAIYQEQQGQGSLHDTLRYDRRGNLANDDAFAFSYDIHGRLIEARSLVDGSVTRIFWDAFDRPVRIGWSDGTGAHDRRLVWLGEDLISEEEDIGAFNFYIRGAANELIAFQQRTPTQATRYHAHAGDDGSVQFLTKPDGDELVESYTYTALGAPKIILGPSTTTATGNRLSWHGHYYLREVGVALVGPRAYVPYLGRFLQPDPAGPLANGFAVGNSYSYGSGNGFGHTDNGYLPAPLIAWAGYVGVMLIIAAIAADVVAPALYAAGYLGWAQGVANFGIFHNLAAFATGEETYSGAKLTGGERILRGLSAFAALIGGLAVALKLLRVGATTTQALARGAAIADASDNIANVVGGTLCGNPLQVVLGALGIGAARMCFGGGTLVLTSEGPIAIERLRPGDEVLSLEPASGELGFQRVLRVYRGQAERFCEVELRVPATVSTCQGDYRDASPVTCTAEHPFQVVGRGWVPAIALKAGDLLVSANGEPLAVRSLAIRVGRAPHFNLEVASWHTFFVAVDEENAVLVHNLCPTDAQDIVDKIHMARVLNSGERSSHAAYNAFFALQMTPTALTWFTHNGKATYIVSSVGEVTKNMRAAAIELLGPAVKFVEHAPKGHAEIRGGLARVLAGVPEGTIGHQVASHFACKSCSRRLSGAEFGVSKARVKFGIVNHTGSVHSHGTIARSLWRSKEILIDSVYNGHPLWAMFSTGKW